MNKRYIAFFKPYGVLSQFTGESNQRTLAEFGIPSGVYAAGRLDKDSEGLLLLTNDGPFKNKLLNPKSNHKKIYWAQVEGIPNREVLSRLQSGVVIKGYRTKRCQVKIIYPDVEPRDPPIRERRAIPTAWLQLTLSEGKNRQVRRMTAKVGHPTLRLIRVGIEALTLKELEPGQWRDVSRGSIFK